MRTFEKPLLALSALALLGALAITARAEDGAAKPTTSSDYKSSETKWKFNPGSGATEAVESTASRSAPTTAKP
ncbi:MAG: hypothetical protein HY075_00425 [Deltaproteobacteria bacterium]|nr:hypothetical protein [Deltaproteobacteria bacterium]